MGLDDQAWKVFRLEDIFECTKGVYLSTKTVTDGRIPYVTAKEGNNGLNRFIGNGILFDGNKITIEKIRLNAYYQPFAFYCSHDVSVIWNEHINEYNAHFIATMIMRNGNKYSYGRQAQLNVVKREAIMLPVTDDGDPDYQFMEDYIRKLIDEKKKQYQVYVKQRIEELCAVSGNQRVEWESIIESHDWEPFQIDAIFNILPGKRLVAADSTPGDRPFIGALDNSNGIARFVSDNNASLDKNVLGVNYNGNGMVIGFYHPYECIFSDDVKRFHLKDWEDNPFILLFMKTVILMQKKKFGYLYKFNADRMAHTNIMLPVTDDGQPDYDFMEEFGRTMMLKKYSQYLSFLALSATTK